MKIVRVSFVALLLVAGSVACSSEPTAEPAPVVTSSSPSTSQTSREDGAKLYLSLVEPFNKELEKCTNVYNRLIESGSSTPGDFPKLRSACADLPDANRAFADGLSNGKWPAEAQASISQLADELRADQLAWQEVSKARVHDDLFDPEYPLSEDRETANLVRARLGLPSVEE